MRWLKQPIALVRMKLFAMSFFCESSNLCYYQCDMKKKAAWLFLSFLSILTGGGVYLLFRNRALFMFYWFGFSYKSVLEVSGGSPLTNFAVYSLPDGLWLFSCIIIIGVIWESVPCLFYIYSIPVIVCSIAMEFLQIKNVVHGTYDPVDVVTFFISGCIGMLLYHLYIKET